MDMYRWNVTAEETGEMAVLKIQGMSQGFDL